MNSGTLSLRRGEWSAEVEIDKGEPSVRNDSGTYSAVETPDGFRLTLHSSNLDRDLWTEYEGYRIKIVDSWLDLLGSELIFER